MTRLLAWLYDDELLFCQTKYGPAKVIGVPNDATDRPAYENIFLGGEIIAALSYIKST